MHKLIFRVVVLQNDVAFLNIVLHCDTLDDLAQAIRTVSKHFPPDENFQIVCQQE